MFCSETLFPWQRTGQRSGTLNWAPTGTLVSGLCTGFVFQETNIIAASNNAVQQGTVAKISSRRFVWLCILFPVAPKGEMQHFYASLKINFLSCDIWTESIFRPHFLRQIKKKNPYNSCKWWFEAHLHQCSKQLEKTKKFAITNMVKTPQAELATSPQIQEVTFKSQTPLETVCSIYIIYFL